MELQKLLVDNISNELLEAMMMGRFELDIKRVGAFSAADLAYMYILRKPIRKALNFSTLGLEDDSLIDALSKTVGLGGTLYALDMAMGGSPKVIDAFMRSGGISLGDLLYSKFMSKY